MIKCLLYGNIEWDLTTGKKTYLLSTCCSIEKKNSSLFTTFPDFMYVYFQDPEYWYNKLIIMLQLPNSKTSYVQFNIADHSVQHSNY